LVDKKVKSLQRGGDANIAPASFGLAKSSRVWKAMFAKVLVGFKVCPPYAINCQHLPSMPKFYAVAKAFAIVNQAGKTRFFSKKPANIAFT
jgi:hypothetical protein